MTTEIYKLHFDQQNGLTQINSTLNELADNEVRIQVLFTGINKNDLLYLDGKHRNDYFGV
jgi:NADPH:quinone reductase-like Zn-dependent oxidoreductase